MAILRDGLETIELKKWKNKHQNFTYKPDAQFRYKLRNPNPGGISKLERYNATTENIKFLLDHALLNNFKIRVLGSGWSYTKIGIAKDCFVDTKSLNLSFSIGQQFLNPGNNAEDTFFIQCGKSIRQLNDVLERQITPARSIIASGASNGQTIAGATSTGTHGSAFKVGAVHDAIIGLHIITAADDHIYLQPSTGPVCKDDFANVIQARPVYDDDLFNAALVSFGSFGFIHGIMIRTEPIFLLEKYRTRTSLTNALRHTMNTLDFTNFPLPQPSNGITLDQLYHFQVVVNPYNIKNGGNGVYIQTMYKVPYRPDYIKKTPDSEGYTYGDDSLGFISTFLNNLVLFKKKVTAALVNNLINLQYNDADVFPWFGTIGETFSYTSLRGKTASCAMGIDVSQSTQALDIVLDIIEQSPLPGVIAFRYVKGSNATLAFTKFPITCVMELDGLDSKDMHDFFDKVWKALENAGINFTLHWGKINSYLTEDKVNVVKSYGAQRINQWKSARERILNTAEMRNVFTNHFMEKLGLDLSAPVQPLNGGGPGPIT